MLHLCFQKCLIINVALLSEFFVPKYPFQFLQKFEYCHINQNAGNNRNELFWKLSPTLCKNWVCRAYPFFWSGWNRVDLRESQDSKLK